MSINVRLYAINVYAQHSLRNQSAIFVKYRVAQKVKMTATTVNPPTLFSPREFSVR